MRVSNTLIVLAWIGVWLEAGGAAAQQSGESAPRASSPSATRLYWPFTPGEQWRINRSWGAPGAHSDSDFNDGRGAFALDLARPPLQDGRRVTAGSAILSAGRGRVVRVVNPQGDALRQGYGRYVVVDHGSGYRTLYAHLERIDVREGAEVKLFQRVGVAGSTGTSTGPHLHFEVRRVVDGRETRVDPTPFMYPSQGPLAGIATSARAIRFTAADIHPDDQRALAEDVAKLVQQALGGKKPTPPRIVDPKPLPPVEPTELATPNRLPGLIPEAQAAERGEPLTLESVTFVPPQGLPVRRGSTDKVLIFGDYPAYVTVQRHPGFPNMAYTPGAIADWINRISMLGKGTKQTMKVGKDALPGIHLARPGGTENVLFPHGGHVYMISHMGQEQTFRRVVESVSAKKK